MTVVAASRQLAERYLRLIGFNKDQMLRNMCLTIISNVDTWPIDKTSRWLGFIQKSLIDLDLTTSSRERKFTDELFDRAYRDSGIDFQNKKE